MTVNRFIFAVRIYFDSIPSVADAADIGLYAVSGENSVFRWIEADISDYSPTYTWKKGILKPQSFGSIHESMNISVGGNRAVVGGMSIKVTNTLSYGGAPTQLDDILESNALRLNSLRCDIIEFEIQNSDNTLVNADGTIRFRGVLGDPQWTEDVMTIPAENSNYKRRSNLSTVINQDNYPDSKSDNITSITPISLGRFKPEVDEGENYTWRNYAKFLRTANTEDKVNLRIGATIVNDLDSESLKYVLIRDIQPNEKRSTFPVVGDDGEDVPIMYKIKLGTRVNWYSGSDWSNDEITTSRHRLNTWEGQYVKVIEALGDTSSAVDKRRQIESAWVDVGADETVVEITMSDFFSTTLQGNEDATDDNQCWIEISDINRQYTGDVWPCGGYLDESGSQITQALELYSYEREKIAEVGSENVDAPIRERPEQFYRLPNYAYEDSQNGDNNALDIDVKLFEKHPDDMKSFLVVPVRDPKLVDDDVNTVIDTWDVLNYPEYINDYEKQASGFYTTNIYPGLDPSVNSTGNIDNIIDQDRDTNVGVNYVWDLEWPNRMFCSYLISFELPRIPIQFTFDKIYLGLKFTSEMDRDKGTDRVQDFLFRLKSRRFIGTPTSLIEKESEFNDINLVKINMDDMPDFYYTGNAPETKNENFYVENEGVEIDDVATVSGYTLFEMSITNNSTYENVVECLLYFEHELRVYFKDEYPPYKMFLNLFEVAIIFEKGITVRESIYTGFDGRKYDGNWGRARGSSSSSSSSSSSQSSSSTSLSSSSTSSSSSSLSSISSSSSSQSSPSSSSLSSSSFSRSSVSSPSSSSSSSTSLSSSSSSSADHRRNANEIITNPIDIIEHVLRLQDWSENGNVRDWGKEYASSPDIDISTSEGGLDYEDLNTIKALNAVRQVKKYDNAYSDNLIKTLCRQFFVCSFQDPATGNERINYIAERSLTTPTVTIAYDQIIGEIKPVKFPKSEGIYCEPVIRYAKNNASDKFERVIQITNSDADTYSSDYVTGLNGDMAELMWTRASALRQAVRKVETPPKDMTDCLWLTNKADAVWYLDTWFTWMGALNTDGTTGGVTFQPKRRVKFTISYTWGKDLFLSQHVIVNFPHQTDGDNIEGIITDINKHISMGQEKIDIEVILYSTEENYNVYVQDICHYSEGLKNWTNSVDLQGVSGGGNDIECIT